MKEKQHLTTDELAEIRLEFCRDSLIQKYPEFACPLKGLKFQARSVGNGNPQIDRKRLSTDGLTVYYSGEYVSNRIVKQSLECQLMHIVLHGVLGHFQQQKEYEEEVCRDLLMDVQVAYLVECMGAADENKENELSYVKRLLHGDLSMKQYYRVLREPKLRRELNRMAHEFRMDDHEEWDYKQKMQEEKNGMEGMREKYRKKVEEFWNKAREYVLEEQSEDAWKRLGARFEEENNRLYGTNSGKLGKKYGLQDGKGRSYAEILRELLSVRELVREEPDSIDPMYYHYGLEMYDDVPLVEPLEYMESRCFDLIVIAVDTSGSCTNERLMGQFWEETYSFLMQAKEICGGGELLIVQCDMKIQEEQWLKLEEVQEQPMEVMTYGGGGTSFIPVFDRIKELELEHRRVDALLYLTDGMGSYPEQEPEYPVYFVMEEKQCDVAKRWRCMPDWIEVVRLEEH